MVTVYRAPSWKLAVYGRDHGVPHVHIEGPGYRCSVAIETGEMIIGTAPALVRRAAVEWIAENRTELMALWLELNG